jgi:hypothetical protein
MLRQSGLAGPLHQGDESIVQDILGLAMGQPEGAPI